MNNKIKTIFIGTPDFGLPAMRSLINDSDFEVLAVVTQPDKPVGRKQILTSPPIKSEALKNKITIFQPEKISSIEDELKKINPDIIIVVAYAQIIPKQILDLPKYGVINVHGSLLPKYRGASCVQAAILNGDSETGVTIMKMDEGLDTGQILAKKEVEIAPNDTAGTLYTKLSNLGAEILGPTIKKYILNEIRSTPQEGMSSYAKQLKKQDGKINWNQPAENIERFVRAMNPWPGAQSILGGKSRKIIEAEKINNRINDHKIGELFLYENKLAIQCGQGALVINKLQTEGKKEMLAEEFLRGHKSNLGSVLE